MPDHLICEMALIHRLWLPAEPDPEPAQASQKQLEKRDGRTFSVQFEIFQLYDSYPA